MTPRPTGAIVGQARGESTRPSSGQARACKCAPPEPGAADDGLGRGTVLAESEESLHEPLIRGAEARADCRLHHNVKDKGTALRAAWCSHHANGGRTEWDRGRHSVPEPPDLSEWTCPWLAEAATGPRMWERLAQGPRPQGGGHTGFMPTCMCREGGREPKDQ